MLNITGHTMKIMSKMEAGNHAAIRKAIIDASHSLDAELIADRLEGVAAAADAKGQPGRATVARIAADAIRQNVATLLG